jgi:hypothetical protein
MHGNIKIALLTVVIAIISFPLTVRAIDGSTYRIDPAEEVYGVSHSVSGSSYSVDGSIGDISARTSSTSFTVDTGASLPYLCGDGFKDPGESCDGSDLNSATCVSQGFASGSLSCSSTCTFVTTSCASSGGGGGGGGGGSVSSTPTSAAVESPAVDETFTEDEPVFTYSDTAVIYGDREEGQTILVNGSEEGVEYPTDTSWSAVVDLEDIGDNDIEVVAVDEDGEESEPVEIEVDRRSQGDVNDDRDVDDYDLSLIIKYWGTDEPAGDLNADGIVDDYDFSIFVSRWGT